MLVVVDTNVLVSGLLNPFGSPGAVVSFLLEGRITPCYDARILSEYQGVFARPKFGFHPEETAALLDYIRENGRQVSAVPVKIPLRDASDLPFLECALATRAAVLVTGNLAHFPKRIGDTKVMPPHGFVKLLVK
jgi:putative PIN family toxin of toxin-antitoxin system